MDSLILLVHSRQFYEVQTGDLDFASITGDYSHVHTHANTTRHFNSFF